MNHYKFNYLFLLIVFPILLNAQQMSKWEKSVLKKYEDYLEEDGEVIFVRYHQTFEKVNGKQFILKTYNPDKVVMTNLVTYEDIGMRIREGDYKEWYDNGELWKKGEYKEDKASGEWRYFDFKTNKLIKYGNYKEGLGEDLWTWIDTTGNKTKECLYAKGKLNNKTVFYSPNGDTVAIKNYSMDELIDENIIDSLGYLVNLNEPDEMPVLEICSNLEGEERVECQKTKWLETVYSNIYYPEIARKEEVEGQAKFEFYIDKEGNIKNLVTIRGLCKEIEDLCLKVLHETPKWTPGLKNGKPVKVIFKQSINFRLE